ncbi:uncharacterized protein KQ657_003338 [Scheffersomyces spartinae]|uniref:Thioredoxin n=1 Tax=Scheffersomyces spartinae TaxID=45513 RepID=A0A9P8AK65_9ASCO|nr:uncharacterized protein KQ657_003338 [Scheffersomyces spartinae]KAG7195571.1 hypothetical protein KQ657_003338 [Scheffersomyces spartinae]
MPIDFITSTREFEDCLVHNKYLVANFTATWCGPCQAIKPLVDQMYENTAKYGNIEVVRIDIDAQSELASRYSVTSIPTFLVFESGELTKRLSSANVSELTQAFDQLALKATDGVRKGSGAKAVLMKVDDDELKSLVPKGYEILNPKILMSEFVSFNASPLLTVQTKDGDAPSANQLFKLEENSPVYSDADSQLLFYVPFTSVCKVYSVLLKVEKVTAVEGVALDEEDIAETQFPNIINVINGRVTLFDEAVLDTKHHHEKLEGKLVDGQWYECKLKYVRFQTCYGLSIFFDGEDEDYHTVVKQVVLVGVSGESAQPQFLQRLEE